jgi:hypothetical protein
MAHAYMLYSLDSDQFAVGITQDDPHEVIDTINEIGGTDYSPTRIVVVDYRPTLASLRGLLGDLQTAHFTPIEESNTANVLALINPPAQHSAHPNQSRHIRHKNRG